MLKSRQQSPHKLRQTQRHTKRHASAKKSSSTSASNTNSTSIEPASPHVPIQLDQLLSRKQFHIPKINNKSVSQGTPDDAAAQDNTPSPGVIVPQPIYDPFLAATSRSSFNHAFNPDLSKQQLFLKSAQRKLKLNALDLSNSPSTATGQQLINRNWGVQNVLGFLKTQKVSQMVVFDTSAQNPSCDFTIICNVSSSKPMQALTEKLVALGRMNKGLHYDRYTSGGDPDGLWSVADLVNIVVHVLTPIGRTAPMFQRVERKLLIDAKLIPLYDWDNLLDPWKRQDQEIYERLQDAQDESIHNALNQNVQTHTSRTKFKTWEQVQEKYPELAGQPPPPGFYIRGNKKAISPTYNDTDDDEADFNYLDLNEEHMNKMQLMADLGYQDKDVQIDPDTLGKSIMGTVELMKVNIDHYKDTDTNKVLKKKVVHEHYNDAYDDDDDDDDDVADDGMLPDDAPDHLKAKQAKSNPKATLKAAATPKKLTKKQKEAQEQLGAIENNPETSETLSSRAGRSSTSVAGDMELNGSSIGGRGRKRQPNAVRDGNVREFSTFIPRAPITISSKSHPKSTNNLLTSSTQISTKFSTTSTSSTISTKNQSIHLTPKRHISSEPDQDLVSLTSTSSKSPTLFHKTNAQFHSNRHAPIEGFPLSFEFSESLHSSNSSHSTATRSLFSHNSSIFNHHTLPTVEQDESSPRLGLDFMLLGVNDSNSFPRHSARRVGQLNRHDTPAVDTFDDDFDEQFEDDFKGMMEMVSTQRGRPYYSNVVSSSHSHTEAQSGSDWMEDLDDITSENHNYKKSFYSYEAAETVEDISSNRSSQNVSSILHQAASNGQLGHGDKLRKLSTPQTTFQGLDFDDDHDDNGFLLDDLDGDDVGMVENMTTLGSQRRFTTTHLEQEDIGLSDALANHGLHFNPHEVDADEDCDIEQFSRLLGARPGSLSNTPKHFDNDDDFDADGDWEYEDATDDVNDEINLAETRGWSDLDSKLSFKTSK